MTALFGRILLAAIFILSGCAKLFDYEGTYAHMQAAGIPYTGLLLVIAACVEILGGLSVATGTYARLGALALIGFLIPTTVVFHHFWTLDGPEKIGQMANFMKNVAIAGGLMQVVAYGAGRIAVDNKLRHQGTLGVFAHPRM